MGIRGLIIGAVLFCAWPAHADPAFQALLDSADAIRSADAPRFLAELERLDGMLAQATPLQRQHLRFLHTYRLALEGDSKTAIAELRQLFEETTDPTLKFRAGLFIANNYAVTRQYSEGLLQLDKTLALLPQVANTEVRQVGRLTAAILYNQAGQYQLSKEYSEALLAESAQPRTHCMAGTSRLETLYNLGTLPDDDAVFDTQIAQCLEAKEVLAANYARGYLARKWAAQGQRRQAIELLERYLPEAESTRYSRLIGDFHSLLAEYLLAEGEVSAAEAHARRAIDESTGIQFSLPLVVAYKTLFEIAQARGDLKAALDHYRHYAEADKAYLDTIKARELAVQMVGHETAQKVQTIALLGKQNEVLQLGEQVARQAAVNSKLLLAFLALLLASITYWAYRTKRTQMALRRLAETDALTGVSNRHHFTREAQAAIERCAKLRMPVSMIMFDLDHFKSINDRFGHATGDFVLQQIARAVQVLGAPGHIFGRLGGEEFAFALPGVDLNAAIELAERCRVAIADVDCRKSGSLFTVSASFGVSSTWTAGYDLRALLSQGDQASYKAKHAGRNQVCVYGEAAADTAAA